MPSVNRVFGGNLWPSNKPLAGAAPGGMLVWRQEGGRSSSGTWGLQCIGRAPEAER